MSDEKRVEFWCDGTKVVGLYGVPEGASGPVPAIVLCVGFSLVKEVWLLDFARRLRKAGYATLNIDYRTFGESGGEPRARLIPRMQVEDVRAAMSWLEGQPEVDGARLGVFGISLGGTIAAGTAAADRRVRAAVSIAAPGDLERIWTSLPSWASFGPKIRAARSQYAATGEVSYIAVDKLLANDPETVALINTERPKHPRWRSDVTFESLADLTTFSAERGLERSHGMLFIHPGADELVGPEESRRMHAVAGEPKKLVVLEGMRHVEVYGNGRAFERVCEESCAWFDAQLRG